MNKSGEKVTKCKMFLGGLSVDITVDATQNWMSEFGKVNHVIIILN